MERLTFFIFFVICYLTGITVGILFAREPKKRKNEKPIIRHCKNCEYCGERFACDYCTVIYRTIDLGRPKALLCRFYKKKEGGRDDR